MMDPEKLADVIATAIRTATAPLAKRIGQLETRCQELESRPRGLKYLGTWSATEGPYVLGDVTTDKGAMWHCNALTRKRPGESPDWTLCVKAGRDAR